MSKGLEEILPHTTENGNRKQKPTKQLSISPEEVAARKAAAREKVLANTLKSKQMTKLSPEERNELRRQEEARKLAEYQDRWEASHSARMQFCRYASIACLIVSPQRLDPIVGTAACQQYALLAVVFHTLLRQAFSPMEWHGIEEICRQFIGQPAISDSRANLLPIVNYEFHGVSPEIESLLAKCSILLSPPQLRYLQLALLLWEGCVLSFDEFGQVCRFRGNASLGKHESELRSEFSCLADQLYAEETKRVLPLNKKLLEVYRGTTAEYYMDKERVYPVKCPSVFTTFDINNHIAWNSDLVIAIGVTRVGISKESYLAEVNSSLPQRDCSYQLGFCDIFYYRKGHSTFDLIENPSEEDKSQACIFFDCVGTSFTNTNNAKRGMFSLDKTEFREHFKTIDSAWLLTSWAAGHPDHAGRAEQMASKSLRTVHSEIYGDNTTRKLAHSPSQPQHLDFSLPADQQITPPELLHYGLNQATLNNQLGEHYFNDISVSKTEAVPRTTSELYFHVVHVYASIGRHEEQRLRVIEERHMSDSGVEKPRLGRYIFTASKSGLSCATREQAMSLQASTKRLTEYLANYPGHEVFCEGVAARMTTAVGESAMTTIMTRTAITGDMARRMSCAASAERVDRSLLRNVTARVK